MEFLKNYSLKKCDTFWNFILDPFISLAFPSFRSPFIARPSCFVKKFKRSSIIQQIHDAFCGFTLGFLVFFPLLLPSASSPFVKWLSFARFNHFFQQVQSVLWFYPQILPDSSIARRRSYFSRTIIVISDFYFTNHERFRIC